MEKEERTHYRKVFKSDHLGVADLEDLKEAGHNLIFLIAKVKQEIGVTVAGKKGNHNIAYFAEDIKPWVINAGNCKKMKQFNDGSPVVQDWDNTLVQLYIDPNAKMKGEIVGGVRINPTQPKLTNNLTPECDFWSNAVTFLAEGGDLKKVTKKYKMTAGDKEKLLAEVEREKLSENP